MKVKLISSPVSTSSRSIWRFRRNFARHFSSPKLAKASLSAELISPPSPVTEVDSRPNLSKWDLTYSSLSVTSEKGILGRGRGLAGQDWGRHLLSQAVGRHLHFRFSRFGKKRLFWTFNDDNDVWIFVRRPEAACSSQPFLPCCTQQKLSGDVYNQWHGRKSTAKTSNCSYFYTHLKWILSLIILHVLHI